MEEQASQASSPRSRATSGSRTLDRQRRRAEELLAAQKARLEKIETDIGAQLEVLSQVVAAESDPVAIFAADELRQRAESLERQAEELNRDKLALAENERRWAEQQREATEQLRRQQEQLHQLQTAIAAADSKLRQAERDEKLGDEQLAERAVQLARREGSCTDLEQRLRREQDQLELQREQTKTQRRRIAQELKAERASQQRELDRLRHDVELYQAGQRQSFEQAAKQLQQERAEFDEKLGRQRDEIRRQQVELEEKEAGHQESHRHLAARERQLAQERSDEAERLRQEIALWQQQSAAAQEATTKAVAEFAALQQAHEKLHHDYDELSQADQKLRHDYDELQQADQKLRHDYDEVCHTEQKLHHDYDELSQADQKLRQDYDEVCQAEQKLHHDYDELWQADQKLQQIHEELRQSYATVEQALAVGQQAVDELSARHDRQTQAYNELQQAYQQTLDAQHHAERTLNDNSAAAGADAGELDELRRDRAAIIARLADAEEKLANVDQKRNDELQRRFELAIDDVRSLKRRNSELEEEVLGLKSAGPRPVASASGEAPNWESMKRQMLESLEADPDKGQERSEERATIENTILITDDVVSHKDREIAELKLLLSQQSSNLGSVAVGAAAIAAVMDEDELIRQERAKLAQLQDEWKSKLRQAEIDISVERAKITRDRAEIEDKLANFASERARHGADPGPNGAAAEAAKKPVRGRWLARLGLKDGE